MTFTTQYISCNISIVKYMYCLSECFRSESNSEPKMEYKMDLFAKVVQGCDPSTIFFKKLHLRCSTEFEYHSAESHYY